MSIRSDSAGKVPFAFDEQRTFGRHRCDEDVFEVVIVAIGLSGALAPLVQANR